jgi:hypothetical protein
MVVGVTGTVDEEGCAVDGVVVQLANCVKVGLTIVMMLVIIRGRVTDETEPVYVSILQVLET